MANIIIQGGVSGTGSTTITGPSTNNTNTVTLPDTTGGSIMVSSNMPAFSAYLGSNQSLSSGTFTKLQINTKNFDTNNYFDATTNYRFTPLIAGYYQINAAFYPNTSTSAAGSLVLYKNGSQLAYLGEIISSNVKMVNGVYLVYMNGSTDYLELFGYSSITTTVAGSSQLTYFQATMVRSA